MRRQLFLITKIFARQTSGLFVMQSNLVLNRRIEAKGKRDDNVQSFKEFSKSSHKFQLKRG